MKTLKDNEQMQMLLQSQGRAMGRASEVAKQRQAEMLKKLQDKEAEKKAAEEPKK